MPDTIEKRVADTLLQSAKEVVVCGETYKVAPPTVATLVLASEAISRLPKRRLDKERVVEESLAVAKDCEALGEVAAILILGAKGVKVPDTYTDIRREPVLGGLFHRKKRVTVHCDIDQKTPLAKKLLEEFSPSRLNELIGRLLYGMELGDFFGLTTFLGEINLLRPTKVETN